MTGERASVLIVHNAYRQRGGEETVLATESAMLRRHGHRVAQLIVDNRRIDDSRGLGATVRLAAETVWSSRGRRLVARAIAQFRPDVVHVHNTFPRLSPAIYGACRDAGIPVVQTVHNFRLVCPSSTLFRDGRECLDCVGRPALSAVVHACYRGSRTASATVAGMLSFHRIRGTWVRDVDAYVVYSPWAAAVLDRGGIPVERIHVRSQFARDRAIRQGWGEGFLFAGRLTAEKGIGTLLSAWEGLPGVELHIAGEGPLGPQVAAAAQRGHVTALGLVGPERIDRELLGARALVLASRTHEMGPLAVVEAYAAGVPVIAPAMGGIPSLVEEGVTGLLYLPGDAASLAAAVRWAHDHPDEMQVMGAAARRRYEERHSEERSYVTLNAIYRRVVAEARAP